MWYSGLLDMSRGSVKVQKCHKNKIYKSKNQHAESTLSEINPVKVGFGPGKNRIFN
jgi:hypothetical protein